MPIYMQSRSPPKHFRRHGRRNCLIGIVVLIVVAAAITVPLLLTKRSRSRESDTDPDLGTTDRAILGHNGSELTLGDGTSMIYVNPFGGSWAYDPTDPFAPGGQAQEWSKRVGENWVWGEDVARGVNLG